MMIVTDNKNNEQEPPTLNTQVGGVDDIPPPYIAQSPSSPSPSTEPSPGPSPPQIPATNFLNVVREYNAIRGVYVVDPELEIPVGLLPATEGGGNPNEEGSERKNLKLESSHGSIGVDIWLIDSKNEGENISGSSAPLKNHATLEAKSTSGSVRINLRTTSPSQTYSLIASSYNGSVSVALPSSFVGPVTVATAYGSVRFSDPVAARLITFSEVDKKRTCFLGDFRTAGYVGNNTWKGSTLEVTSYTGSVRVSYVDEPEQVSVWRKIFGL